MCLGHGLVVFDDARGVSFNPVQKKTYNKLLRKKGYGPDKAMVKLGVKPFSVSKIPSRTPKAALRIANPKKIKMWLIESSI